MIAHLAALVLALAPPPGPDGAPPGMNPVAAYNQGNRLYAAKDYAGAAHAYQEALAAGPSAAVHFNLGNALFKTGQLGQAILHYRRAHFLAPRDADIAANLDFARAYRVDKTLTLPSPLARALERAFHALSRREAALAAAVLFALGSALVSVWIVRRWTWVLVVACGCGAGALYGLIAERVWAAEIGARPAVVVLSEVSALAAPSDEAKQILLLHDGSEVTIRDARGDYLLVQLPGGGGWVPKGAVERVY
jgi:tetratricopeptide (TPR) repeat protein